MATPENMETSSASSRTTVFNTRIRIQPRKEPVVAPVPISSVTSVSGPHATVLLLYSPEAAAACDPVRLQSALHEVVESFPHLTGRLRLVTPADKDIAPAYAQRFRRPWIEYGSELDPGFLFVVERRASSMAEVMPTKVGEYDRVFDATPTNDPTLAPGIAKALVPGHEDEILPAAGLKLTLFADGGAAFCASASHVLCDAGALGVFLRHLMAAYHSIPLPAPPVLDYVALDAQAAGHLNSAAADPGILEKEKQLDVFRYDSWALHPAAPPGFQPAPDHSIDEVDEAQGRSRGEPPRWDTSTAAPALAYLVEFSPEDIDRIYDSTVAGSAAKISRQDAFVGHLWRLIARSRGQTGDQVLDCAMACDSRGRLGTPLDPDTPGCWNVCLGFQSRAGDILGTGGALVAAQRVRAAISTVNPTTVPAWLHKRAHDLDPTREWIVFPGNHTVCTTNWTRCAFYSEMDFGAGGPLFAHNPVTGFGGFACVLKKCGAVGSGGEWYKPGVVVALWLEEEAMPRLLADPELRGDRVGA